jgi:hypothetical protein
MSSAATVRCPLPEIDYRFLEEKGWQYEVVVGSGEVRVYIRGFELPGVCATVDRSARPAANGLPAGQPGYVLDETRRASCPRRVPKPC